MKSEQLAEFDREGSPFRIKQARLIAQRHIAVIIRHAAIAVEDIVDAQRDAALRSKTAFHDALSRAGYGPITTEIREAPEFYYAESYHQQYLAKNPNGYCGLGSTGVTCPVGVELKA